jgi:hypothetical protein
MRQPWARQRSMHGRPVRCTPLHLHRSRHYYSQAALSTRRLRSSARAARSRSTSSSAARSTRTSPACVRTPQPWGVYTHGAAAALPHYTCGQTYFYPAFDAAQPEDATKLAHELSAAIAMPLMLEAITRIRASKGQSLHQQRFVSY